MKEHEQKRDDPLEHALRPPSERDDPLESGLGKQRAKGEELMRKIRTSARRKERKREEELGLRPRQTSFTDAEREALADESVG